MKSSLSSEQLNFIKEKYNWNNQEFLIINFRLPKESCHYDNYRNLKNSKKWWTEFYSDVELSDSRNIFIYSDSVKAKKVIDGKFGFPDYDDFFSNSIFLNDKACYGLIVINQKGDFYKKAGEYQLNEVLSFKQSLN